MIAQLFIVFMFFVGGISSAILLYTYAKNKKRSVNELIGDHVVLKITVPADNATSPQAAEQLFQSLHGIIRSNIKSESHYSFEISASSFGIYFIVICPTEYNHFVLNQVYAQYPSAQIEQIHDYASRPKDGLIIEGVELSLKKEFFLPIKTFTSFEVDPLASITSAVSRLTPGNEVWIQLVARPIADVWQEEGKAYVNNLRKRTDEEGKKTGLSSGEGKEISEIERKNQKSGFQFVMRIMSAGTDSPTVQSNLRDVEASLKQYQTAQFNALSSTRSSTRGIAAFINRILGKAPVHNFSLLEKYTHRYLSEFESGIINTEELASLYHLPNKSVKTPNIGWVKSKKVEPPLNLPKEKSRIFAYTDYRNNHIPFGISKEDRRRHMYLLGKTGTGKSMLMKQLILGDIYDHEGVAVIDPHGDLVEELLDLIPEERMKDVIYLDPSDMEHPIGLNMLDAQDGESKELLADGIVSVFIKLFGFSFGPRLQYILTNTILTLLHCQNVSLLAVQRILLDENYRKFLLKQVDDPFLIKFWEEEYASMSKNTRLITEAISPIQNKVGRFLSSPLVRNMIGQVKSEVNLTDVMNDGKILLVNLSQGKIGEENTALLGGMLITRLYTNAMQRANIASDKRRDFYLYVDEFQNFATSTFVKILSEARKYGLNLMVTHQFIDQITPEIQDAIFGNVGTLMNYVVGPKDAARLENEYSPELNAEDLVNLERFRMVLKLTVEGAQTKPFTAIAMPPNYPKTGLGEQVRDISRTNYASNRAEVELKLSKWANQLYDKKGNLVQK